MFQKSLNERSSNYSLNMPKLLNMLVPLDEQNEEAISGGNEIIAYIILYNGVKIKSK